MKRLKADPRLLLLAFLVLAVGFSLVVAFPVEQRLPYSDLQLKAAERMAAAEAYLKEEILSRGLSVEEEDLNGVGLIGPEWTELTSTMGEIGAKRSSLNPEFAAAMVRYFKKAGLESGDTIAVGSSGSFPGFLVAVLSAAEEMGLEVRVIASLGASMFGATRPDFNIFDILSSLEEGGFAHFKLLAVSCGSENDRGGGAMDDFLFENTKEFSVSLTKEASLRTGAEFIYKDTLEESIQRRRELYGEGIKLFVNIGGASPNSGKSSYTLDFPQGLVMDPPKIPDVPEKGLNYIFAEEGIPVLNLLNVKLLSSENGIPFDPVPFNSIGSSQVYYEVTYNRLLALLSLCLSLGLVVAAVHVGRGKKV